LEEEERRDGDAGNGVAVKVLSPGVVKSIEIELEK
jgi:predicted unusual protein kinase regulating ubiquinone biosynthesis (AarF/ABC1/UbiB family)